jgi:hypothetical protein
MNVQKEMINNDKKSSTFFDVPSNEVWMMIRLINSLKINKKIIEN